MERDGYNIPPNPKCGFCYGRGFTYVASWRKGVKKLWAQTCWCKIIRQPIEA